LLARTARKLALIANAAAGHSSITNRAPVYLVGLTIVTTNFAPLDVASVSSQAVRLPPVHCALAVDARAQARINMKLAREAITNIFVSPSS
jgi:hypothetical protein